MVTLQEVLSLARTAGGRRIKLTVTRPWGRQTGKPGNFPEIAYMAGSGPASPTHSVLVNPYHLVWWFNALSPEQKAGWEAVFKAHAASIFSSAEEDAAEIQFRLKDEERAATRAKQRKEVKNFGALSPEAQQEEEALWLAERARASSVKKEKGEQKKELIDPQEKKLRKAKAKAFKDALEIEEIRAFAKNLRTERAACIAAAAVKKRAADKAAEVAERKALY